MDKEMEKSVDKLVKSLEIRNNPQPQPDAKWHQIVSFIKSGIRILGYAFIPFNLVTATVLLILSEIVGIIEELV